MSGSVDHGRHTHESRRDKKVLGTVGVRGIGAVVVVFVLRCAGWLGVLNGGGGDDLCSFVVVFVSCVRRVGGWVLGGGCR